MRIGTNDAVSQTRKKQSWMGTASLWCPYWFNSRVWGIRLHWSVTCLLVASYNTSFVNQSIDVATVFAIPAIWPDLSLRGRGAFKIPPECRNAPFVKRRHWSVSESDQSDFCKVCNMIFRFSGIAGQVGFLPRGIYYNSALQLDPWLVGND